MIRKWVTTVARVSEILLIIATIVGISIQLDRVNSASIRGHVLAYSSGTRSDQYKEGNNTFKLGEVLVKFRKGVNLNSMESVMRQYNATRIRHLYGSDVQIWRIPESTEVEIASQLNADPAVEYAEPNYIYEANVMPNDPDFDNQWAHIFIHSQSAWDITTGNTSITIAIVDSGVDESHPDLAGKILTGYDFVDNDTNPHDLYGHGTHVAGIAAAMTDNDIGIAGMSWGAWILPVRVLGENGKGSSSDLADGIRWAYQRGAWVINLSLTSDEYSQSVQDAVTEAHNAGSLVIAGMGNCRAYDPQKCPVANPISYPAAYDNVIAVAATSILGTYAPYSQHGAHCDIAAPGGDMDYLHDDDGIYSTMPTYDVYLTDRGYYKNYDYSQGTSMATPYVSGLAALIWSIVPTLSPDQVQDIIENTAVDLGPPGWDPDYGHGRIDAYAALLTLRTQPLVTEVTYTPDIGIGEYSEVFVRVSNAGGASDDGGISVSFPSFTDTNDDQYVQFVHTSPDCGYNEYSHGDTIHDRHGGPFPADYLLVESVDTAWENNEENTLTIRVYPQQEGAFEFYVRSAMRGYEGHYLNDPANSGDIDQQGWEVYRYVINVGNTPPYVPHSPSPTHESTGLPASTTLSWSGGDPDGHTVTYVVRLEPDDENPDAVVCTTTDTACDPGPLDLYTDYYWQVTAVDSYGDRTEGPVWRFTTLQGPGPTPPSGLAASITCLPSIDLSWSDNSDDESNFHIERSVNSPSAWQGLVSLPQNTEEYSDLTVECGNTYYYRVRVHRNNPSFQYSEYSNVVSAEACPANLGSFSGYVRNASSSPIEGVSVVILSGSTYCSRLTGPDGHYQMLNLEPGTYSARAQAAGYDPDELTGIPVLAGQDTPNQDFTLQQGSGTPILWGDATQITALEYGSQKPDIAVDSSGNIHVVWMDAWPDNQGDDIFYKKFDGTSWSTNIRLTPETSPSDPTCRYPRIATDPSGNAHVIWLDSRGTEYEIYYSKLDSAGNIVRDQIPITSNDGQREYFADIASDSNGYLHVVWEHRNTTTSEYEIHYAKLDNSGNTVLSRVISSDSSASANRPKIAIDADDDLHIVYERNVAGYPIVEVYYSKLDDSGNILRDRIPITSQDWYSSGDPNITVDSDGALHICWVDQATDLEVYCVEWDGSGSLPGGFPLSDTSRDDWWPGVVAGGAGNVYVTWEDDRDGNTEVYSNIYDGTTWSADMRVTDNTSISRNPEAGAYGANMVYIVWDDSGDVGREIFFIQGEVCTTPPVPNPISPSDDVRTSDDTPTFSWESVGSGASYQLQLSTSTGFTPLSVDTILTATVYTPGSSLAPNTYYWRVRASTACGTGDWSTVRQVTVVGSPSAPALILPSDAISTCDATPSFTWTTADAALTYTLQVDNNAAFDSLEITVSQECTSHTPGTPLSPDTYHWRVSGTNDFFAGPWSTARTVTVLGLPEPPTLSSPAGGGVVDDRTPTLLWATSAGATSYQLQVDNNADFASPEVNQTGLTTVSHTPDAMAEGMYYWRVSATGPCGIGGWSATRSFAIDDLQGPTIATPAFTPFADFDESLLVTAQIEDAGFGDNGVSEALLCYGYSYPYAETCVPGSGPAGDGDGLWVFTIPPQGSGHIGHDLKFSLIATDGDDSPATTSATNNGSYYQLTIVEAQYIYLPLLMNNHTGSSDTSMLQLGPIGTFDGTYSEFDSFPNDDPE